MKENILKQFCYCKKKSISQNFWVLNEVFSPEFIQYGPLLFITLTDIERFHFETIEVHL